jgi:hypothetical protein
LRPLRVLVAVTILLTLLAGGALWTTRARSHEDRNHTEPRAVTPTNPAAPTHPPTTRPAATLRPDGEVAADLARLRALTIPPPAVAPAETRIPEPYRHQPDLYARAFVDQLLTQDYTTPREAHLAWVQSESARTDEPLVTGLVPPELRDRLALFSVTDQRTGPAPIPSPKEWGDLARQDAHTTVTVQRVTEPLAWSNAVEAGRVSDPGVTARQVTATVTLHQVTGGKPRTSTASVALTLNLTGPPTRDTWAFVAVITYRAVPMGSS